MGKININEIEIFAFHGVYENEKVNGQKFLIDIEIEFDFTNIAKVDELANTIDYVKLVADIKDFTTNNRFNLLETLSAKLNAEILRLYPTVLSSKIRIRKPEIVFDVPVKDFYVEHEIKR